MKAAVSAFGSYIEPIAGDITDKTSVKKALKGVRVIICTEKMGMLAEAKNLKGIEHIILLSQLAVFKSGGGIQAFMNEKAKKLAEAGEIAVITSGVSYTIVRAGSLQDKPGGQRGFNFKEGCAGKGTLSREDAAAICVEALDSPAKEGLIFEVVNGEETVQNWNEIFSSLANSGNQE
uniref:NAD(P)-binding domain-containing protein n=1 Tax=Picea sitchensis TaxID=3332 RepID=C0PTT1_PICSI|nr:unknown [Picea sitchensis]